jgi:hypothetical protein
MLKLSVTVLSMHASNLVAWNFDRGNLCIGNAEFGSANVRMIRLQQQYRRSPGHIDWSRHSVTVDVCWARAAFFGMWATNFRAYLILLSSFSLGCLILVR